MNPYFIWSFITIYGCIDNCFMTLEALKFYMIFKKCCSISWSRFNADIQKTNSLRLKAINYYNLRQQRVFIRQWCIEKDMMKKKFRIYSQILLFQMSKTKKRLLAEWKKSYLNKKEEFRAIVHFRSAILYRLNISFVKFIVSSINEIKIKHLLQCCS